VCDHSFCDLDAFEQFCTFDVFIRSMGDVDAAGSEHDAGDAHVLEVPTIGGEGRCSGERFGSVRAQVVLQWRSFGGEECWSGVLDFHPDVSPQELCMLLDGAKTFPDLCHSVLSQITWKGADADPERTAVRNNVHGGAALDLSHIHHGEWARQVVLELSVLGPGLSESFKLCDDPPSELDGIDSQGWPRAVSGSPCAVNTEGGVSGVHPAHLKPRGFSNPGLAWERAQVLSDERLGTLTSDFFIVGPDQHQFSIQIVGVYPADGDRYGRQEALHISRASAKQLPVSFGQFEGV
jgi:hypothetical protein